MAIDAETYSHSNTNGAGNPLATLGAAARRPTCTVRTTDTLMRSSIGAGFRAIGAGCTFRDLSRTVGSCEGSNGSVVSSRQAIHSAVEPTVTTRVTHCCIGTFRPRFYRQRAHTPSPRDHGPPDVHWPRSGELLAAASTTGKRKRPSAAMTSLSASPSSRFLFRNACH
jgi:hypothetical protein